MIAYATVGTNDIEKARVFYDRILAPLGVSVIMEGKTPTGGKPMVAYGTALDKPMLIVCGPYNGESATVGNGSMVALQCNSAEDVKKVHATALDLGAANEGDPGPRGDNSGFYCGYFRDLDGNKLNAFTMVTD